MKTKNTYNFTEGRSVGEMKRQIGIKNTEKVIPSKKVYSRKNKFKQLWD